MTTVSIIVAAHNEGGYLSRTVDNLLSTLPRGGEIIVVDDRSSDGCAESLVPSPAVKLIRPERRLGAMRARNVGARHAGAPIYVFCDAHIEAKRGWFHPVQQLLQRTEVGAAGPVLVEMENRKAKGYGLKLTDASLNWDWLVQQASEPYAVPMLGGFFLAMRRQVFWEIGAFDTGLKTWGMEDLEIGLRLWTLGYQCWLMPHVEVAHLSRRDGSFPDYQIDWETGLLNTLRVAVVHFNTSRLKRVFEHYAGDGFFPAALAALASTDAWVRRQEIQLKRKRDDDWFCRKFGMRV